MTIDLFFNLLGFIFVIVVAIAAAGLVASIAVDVEDRAIERAYQQYKKTKR